MRGFLIDDATGEPLIYALVTLSQDSIIKHGTYSDLEGYFSIENMDPAKYVLTAELLGYSTYVDTALVVIKDKIVSLRINLSEEAILFGIPNVEIECKKVNPVELKQK